MRGVELVHSEEIHCILEVREIGITVTRVSRRQLGLNATVIQ